MKILVVTAALVYWSSFCFSQSINKGSVEKKYYSEISFDMVNEKVILPVEIQGKTYRFLLDTGAPNMMSRALRDKIKTTLYKRIPVSDANNKKDSLTVVTIPELKLGDVVFKDTPTLISTEEADIIFDCFQIDGFIGSNMLRNSIIKIMPKERQLILTDNGKKLNLSKRNGIKMRLDRIQSTPNIWLKVGNDSTTAKQEVIIDLGMKGLYALSNRHYKILSPKNVFQNLSSAEGAMGGGLFGNEDKSQYQRIAIDRVQIAGAQVQNTIAATTRSSNSRVGSQLLNYGDMVLDYKRKRFYYQPRQEQIKLEKTAFGVSFYEDGGKLYVGLVWDKALDDRLQYGDQVIEMNGEDYTNPDICSLIAKQSVSERYDKLNLVVLKSNGEKVSLNVSKIVYE